MAWTTQRSPDLLCTGDLCHTMGPHVRVIVSSTVCSHHMEWCCCVPDRGDCLLFLLFSQQGLTLFSKAWHSCLGGHGGSMQSTLNLTLLNVIYWIEPGRRTTVLWLQCSCDHLMCLPPCREYGGQGLRSRYSHTPANCPGSGPSALKGQWQWQQCRQEVEQQQAQPAVPHLEGGVLTLTTPCQCSPRGKAKQSLPDIELSWFQALSLHNTLLRTHTHRPQSILHNGLLHPWGLRWTQLQATISPDPFWK